MAITSATAATRITSISTERSVMKTNLYRCSKPGQANQMALRYLFSNANESEDIQAIAFSLIQAITGFHPREKELRILRIWPNSNDDLGLDVEVLYGENRYHLSFFFFEYDEKRHFEEGMTNSTSYIRGDYGSKGCFLIHFRPEDSGIETFHGSEGTMDKSTIFAHTNGKLVFDAIGKLPCSDPILNEYIQYINGLHFEMTSEKWGDVWLRSPVGFENYVENYLRHLFSRRYEHKVSPHFYRDGWKSGLMRLSIDTGFDIHDPRGESVDSWFILEFRIEFPRPVATVRLLGDCFCYEDPENWIYEDNVDEAFFRMRKALDQPSSLFVPKGGSSKSQSIVGEYKEGAISLEGEYAWPVLFPEAVFQLVDNLFKHLGLPLAERQVP